MENIYMILLIPFMLSFVIFTFIKRDYKKKLHRAYRVFQGETQDGFISEYMNLFFPIPYRSNNPDFYKIEQNTKLAQRFRIMRMIQFISFGLVVCMIVLQINYGFN